MRLVMLGAPGSGKGTQASRLARHFGVEHIATGDLLRREVAAGTAVGRLVAGHLDRGDLVPDELMVDVVGPRIEAAPGFVLDGFPRNIEQAGCAEKRGLLCGLDLDGAVYLQVPTDELTRRLLQRAGEEGRSDDREETIRHRLSLFEAETTPLIDCYRDRHILVSVNGDQDPDTVTGDILEQLQQVTREGSAASKW